MNKLIVRVSLLSSITSGEGSSALSSEITDTQDGHVVRGGVAVDMVNVYANGVGAEKFGGVFDNTEIFHKLADLTKVK